MPDFAHFWTNLAHFWPILGVNSPILRFSPFSLKICKIGELSPKQVLFHKKYPFHKISTTLQRCETPTVQAWLTIADYCLFQKFNPFRRSNLKFQICSMNRILRQVHIQVQHTHILDIGNFRHAVLKYD